MNYTATTVAVADYSFGYLPATDYYCSANSTNSSVSIRVAIHSYWWFASFVVAMSAGTRCSTFGLR